MPVIHRTQTEIFHPEVRSAPAIAIHDLSFHYPDGRQALEGISFILDHGEKVALVGPNGAGKSTLMLHLNALLQGQHGEILVDGLAIAKENLRIVRGKVGLVFQNPDDQLFSPTVFEDVAFGPLHMGYPEEEIHIRVERALEAVGMGNYAMRLSHHLSVGEKKRIAIATVLAMSPSILVLDEPSAGLDPRARRALINLLRDLPITMLVSTHDIALVMELFPRTMIVDDGRLVADGETATLMNDDGLLAAHGLERP
jgi:cobalt/nickel transport system ATP-binding protein